ncbi:hypothetical protein OSTOST_21266 [Ostertagia ostertagi]
MIFIPTDKMEFYEVSFWRNVVLLKMAKNMNVFVSINESLSILELVRVCVKVG